MQKYLPFLLLTILPLLGGCEIIGGILKFGFFAGIIVILIVVAIIWWIIRMFRSRP